MTKTVYVPAAVPAATLIVRGLLPVGVPGASVNDEVNPLVVNAVDVTVDNVIAVDNGKLLSGPPDRASPTVTDPELPAAIAMVLALDVML